MQSFAFVFLAKKSEVKVLFFVTLIESTEKIFQKTLQIQKIQKFTRK